MFSLGFVVLTHTSVDALNRWILAAVDRNVEFIRLHVFYLMSTAYEIPHQLLNCKSLKTLDLTFFSVPRGVTLPESISLPQVKNLSLEGFSISNSELHRLFSSCPLIKTVSIKGCDILMNNSILVDSQSLQSLRLVDNRHRHVGSIENILFGTTKISAPNVKDFKCTSVMTEFFSANNLTSIVSAHLRMRSTEKEVNETADTYSELSAEEKEVFAIRMMKFLGDVQKVHHLTLSSGFLEVLLQAPGTLYRQPPQLSNLETMKLEMRFTRDCLLSVAYLLKISPVITTLILISKESNLADVGDDWEAEFSLTCMSSHLKSVKIREMEGCHNELKFLGCLLKNSLALQKLTLFFKSASDTLDNGRQIRLFKRNVKVLPAASSNIQLKFYDL